MNDNFIDEKTQEIVTRKLNNSYKIEGYNEGLTVGYDNGKIDGINESKIEIAKSLLEQDISYDVISKSTGLSLEKNRRIKKSDIVYI